MKRIKDLKLNDPVWVINKVSNFKYVLKEHSVLKLEMEHTLYGSRAFVLGINNRNGNEPREFVYKDFYALKEVRLEHFTTMSEQTTITTSSERTSPLHTCYLSLVDAQRAIAKLRKKSIEQIQTKLDNIVSRHPDIADFKRTNHDYKFGDLKILSDVYLMRDDGFIGLTVRTLNVEYDLLKISVFGSNDVMTVNRFASNQYISFRGDLTWLFAGGSKQNLMHMVKLNYDMLTRNLKKLKREKS